MTLLERVNPDRLPPCATCGQFAVHPAHGVLRPEFGGHTYVAAHEQPQPEWLRRARLQPNGLAKELAR